ncbi:sensor histidine kinase [Halobaculum sp. MBLA0147]|uniref:sensor histidine kinase n=1 Tax=Halobaculum sp. MBLA0147 TaxID=3079934 RepID=UPI00352380CD
MTDADGESRSREVSSDGDQADSADCADGGDHADDTDDRTPEGATVDDRAMDERLHSLHAATRELVRAGDRRAVADVAADLAEDVLGFSLNTVRLYDPETDRLEPTAVSSAVTDELGERRAYDRGESVQWRALTADEPVVVHDVAEIDDVDRGSVASVLVVPAGDHGVVTLGSRTADGFDDCDVELARVFAGNVAAALDRAEREEQLREGTTALTRQNERLEEFASVLSHDLRNPLNTAQGRVELAQERDDPDDLPAARDALDRMEALIERLLALARTGSPVEVDDPVSVAEVARDAWGTTPTDAATLSVETDLVVRGDRERLRTLFENLFGNAVDHAAEPPTVVVGDLPAGEGFFVADDGPGIPEEVADRVFDRGFTTANDGTGFGLAIVEEVAEAHGWTVRLGPATAPGLDDTGTRFEIVTEE